MATTPPITVRRPAVRILSCSQLAGSHRPSVSPLKLFSLPKLGTLFPPPPHKHPYLGVTEGSVGGGEGKNYDMCLPLLFPFPLQSSKSSVSLLPQSFVPRGRKLEKRLKFGLLTFPSLHRAQTREECGCVEPRLPVQHSGAHLHRQPRCAFAAFARCATRVASGSARGDILKRRRTGDPDPVSGLHPSVSCRLKAQSDLPGALRGWLQQQRAHGLHSWGWCPWVLHAPKK